MNLLPPYTPTVWKIIGSSVAGLVLLGAVLFTVSKCDNWRSNRAIDKARANVNAAMQNVNAAKAVVSNDAVNEAVAVQQFKDAVNDAVILSNATDAAKVETNKAAANYATAVNENRPVGTTEDDLNRKLKVLDQ